MTNPALGSRPRKASSSRYASRDPGGADPASAATRTVRWRSCPNTSPRRRRSRKRAASSTTRWCAPPSRATVTAVDALAARHLPRLANGGALTNTGAIGLVSNTNMWVDANLERDRSHLRQARRPGDDRRRRLSGPRVPGASRDHLSRDRLGVLDSARRRTRAATGSRSCSASPPASSSTMMRADPPLRAGMSVVGGHRHGPQAPAFRPMARLFSEPTPSAPAAANCAGARRH